MSIGGKLRKVVASFACWLLLAVAQLSPALAQAPAYIGSQACAACHEDAASAWAGSHHALAWTRPGPDTVVADFDGTEFSHKGMLARFRIEDGAYYVTVTETDRSQRDYKVHSVAGIAPLQQYLLETEPGRLQSFDVVWDVEKKRWYHLYPDAELPPGDGLHWTGPYKNWNGRCAECHATGFEKNYAPATRSYASTQAEIGVGCEACHGPGEAHAAWAEAPESYDRDGFPGLTASGLVIDFAKGGQATEIEQCAGCHSRREPVEDSSPLPGTPFHDSYRLSLFREGLYHPDGSILDEVYVYGSFLQSRMYRQGVTCSDCHEPHATTRIAQGNALCVQCHSPAGNPRFPTLRKALYDDPSHHFHEQGSEGAQCASCHMVERVYMGIDWRSDHSFRVPRPDLTETTGAPNACTDCHSDRQASWAAAELESRFPESRYRGPHFSEAIAAGREEPSSVVDLLLEIADDAQEAGIVRATALDLLGPVANATIAERSAARLGDADPLVREAAVALQRGAPPVERFERLRPLLGDEFRTVRIATARALLDLPVAYMPPPIADSLQRAMAEWRRSLAAKADFPETQMAIGGLALVLRQGPAAAAAFREAARLDPQQLDAWIMTVRILATLGKIDDAKRTLDDAISFNPGNKTLEMMQPQLSSSTDQ
ncbi:multiheme c-type cytochrome [Afifella pfennigii]|uniref:multiheme c-type cytochrome n=1 Tax=Afifella pfennigii TaxID=209897 RepID=UPI000AB0C300|nr:multiheme c-type cytochrome [Afifella pfennigii]